MTITDLGYANRRVNSLSDELSAAKKEIKELNNQLEFQRQLIAMDRDVIRFREMLIQAYADGLAQMKRDCFEGSGTLNIYDIDALQETIEDLKR